MLSNNNGLEEWVSVGEGVEAAIVNSTWQQGVDRTIEASSDLRCKIQLEGLSHYSVDDNTETMGADSKMTFLYKPIGSLKREQIKPGTFERSVTFVFPIANDLLAGYNRDDAAVDEVFRTIGNSLFMRRLKMGAATRGLMGSLFMLDRETRCFNRLRRSKLDELACVVLDGFLESFIEHNHITLTTRERRQVRDARDLLMANLVSPPSLSVLAATVGTNRTKLNQGFNAMFGLPVYQFLRRERMMSAKMLLEIKGYSVAEAADACGFEHVSNFSSAFKAFHGVAPSYLRDR